MSVNEQVKEVLAGSDLGKGAKITVWNYEAGAQIVVGNRTHGLNIPASEKEFLPLNEAQEIARQIKEKFPEYKLEGYA